MPKLISPTSKVLTVADLDQIKEVCENDEQNMENMSISSWAGPTKAHSPLCSCNPILLHFECENDVKNVTNCGDNIHGSDCEQQDEVTSNSSTSRSVSDTDSDLYVASDRSSQSPPKHNVLCDVTEIQSQLSVNANTGLVNSDPNVLHVWGAECVQNYSSASSLEMLPVSSPDMSVSCSVPNLSQFCENGRQRKHNGFSSVKMKSQVLGWKTHFGATFSSLPNLFAARNVPKQSRFKHTAETKESKAKPKQKEQISAVPKSHNMVKPTDLNRKEILQTADTASCTVIMRNGGAAWTQIVEPQETVEAINRRALYDIQWSFPEFKKMTCSNTATCEITLPVRLSYWQTASKRSIFLCPVWCLQGLCAFFPANRIFCKWHTYISFISNLKLGHCSQYGD
jgi:hypothetical protein